MAGEGIHGLPVIGWQVNKIKSTICRSNNSVSSEVRHVGIWHCAAIINGLKAQQNKNAPYKRLNQNKQATTTLNFNQLQV